LDSEPYPRITLANTIQIAESRKRKLRANPENITGKPIGTMIKKQGWNLFQEII